MKKLEDVIRQTILSCDTLDWLILHTIARSGVAPAGVEFSFVDGAQRNDEAFRTSQGYISLKTPLAISNFSKVITTLAKEFKSDPLSLANLFIVVTRASYRNEDRDSLINVFKKQAGTILCKAVFDLLIADLNKAYYAGRREQQTPENLEDWLDIFNRSEYTYPISDPVVSSLKLVKPSGRREIEYAEIRNMGPMLRAVLFAFYDYDLKISKQELQTLYASREEVMFLSACLTYGSGRDKLLPDWLTRRLVSIIVIDHWDSIGKYLVRHVYGISFRNKNQNLVFKKLTTEIHNVLNNRIMQDRDEVRAWLGKLEFPKDFISLFNWIATKKVSLDKFPTPNAVMIATGFMAELKRMVDGVPQYLADKNNSDPFLSYELHDERYRITLAYILVTVLAVPDTERSLQNVCHQVKVLFYGAYPATHFASYFTELVLLTFLSAPRVTGLRDSDYAALKRFLKIISSTILVPYIHLAERHDEIWNPESERKVFHFQAGRYLVTEYLRALQNYEQKQHYDEFLSSIEDVAVANWLT